MDILGTRVDHVTIGVEELRRGRAEGGTHYVGGASAVRVRGGVRVAAGAALAVGGAVPGAAAVPLVYHQVDGHLALQAADVPVTEVVAQLVHLPGNKRGVNTPSFSCDPLRADARPLD